MDIQESYSKSKGSDASQIWEHVKEIEENLESSDRQLSEIRATMMVNFGPDGRADNLVKTEYTTLDMVLKVITHYKNLAESRLNNTEDD